MAERPGWAVALVGEVCAAAGVTPPRLRWRRRDRPTSSGVTRLDSGTISLVAGHDELDQRLTLLHELAHWLTLPRRRRRRGARHHDEAFYAVAFELFRRHGIPGEAALAGEAARYPSSLRHAHALGIPGAEAAWSEHRRRLRERAAARGPERIVVAEHRVRLVRDGRWIRCSVCGARIVGPVLRRLRRVGGRHTLLSRARPARGSGSGD